MYLWPHSRLKVVDGVLLITHKTASQGPAGRTIEDPKEQLLLNRYVTYIRPQIKGGGAVSVEAPDPRGREQEGGQAGPPVRQDCQEV